MHTVLAGVLHAQATAASAVPYSEHIHDALLYFSCPFLSEIAAIFVLGSYFPLWSTDSPHVFTHGSTKSGFPCNLWADDISGCCVQHHPHLQQLAARQLQDASRKRIPPAAFASIGNNNDVAPQVRMQYFTGQLSREAIDGVAHLEIQHGDDAADDPDFSDKLQCELVRRAITVRGKEHIAEVAGDSRVHESV